MVRFVTMIIFIENVIRTIMFIINNTYKYYYTLTEDNMNIFTKGKLCYHCTSI
jgi:hypothetical protein